MPKNAGARKCSLLTPHTLVLLFLARNGDRPLREVALAIDMSERAVQMIVTELEDEGYISRRKSGRRNEYTINRYHQISDVLESKRTIGELLSLLGEGCSPTELSVGNSRVTFTRR